MTEECTEYIEVPQQENEHALYICISLLGRLYNQDRPAYNYVSYLWDVKFRWSVVCVRVTFLEPLPLLPYEHVLELTSLVREKIGKGIARTYLAGDGVERFGQGYGVNNRFTVSSELLSNLLSVSGRLHIPPCSRCRIPLTFRYLPSLECGRYKKRRTGKCILLV